MILETPVGLQTAPGFLYMRLDGANLCVFSRTVNPLTYLYESPTVSPAPDEPKRCVVAPLHSGPRRRIGWHRPILKQVLSIRNQGV